MFTATNTATGFGGWGAKPAAPATTTAPFTGFGSSTVGAAAATGGVIGAGGWGAKSTFSAGFGTAPSTQPQQQQQQQQPIGAMTSGWGQPQQPATAGWGMQPQPQQANAGWGAPVQQQQPAMQAQPNYVFLQDFTRQSKLASFLKNLDRAYDALGPACRFRTFVYNACPPGQAEDAVQRERYITFLNGGHVPEEDWLTALRCNPEPGRLYPQPVHFMQELRQRCDKQKTELKRLTDAVDNFLRDAEAVAALDAANKDRLRALRQEEVMLRRRWYLSQQKLEVLARWGQRSGDEGLLLRQIEQLRAALGGPGVFRDALQDLQPLLDSEAEVYAGLQSSASSATGQCSGGGSTAALLCARVDARVMEGWIAFAQQMQDGIQSLHELLAKDKADMRAVRQRLAQ